MDCVRVRSCVLPALLLCVLSEGCVSDAVVDSTKTWRVTNDCDFEVGIHIGDPLKVGNDEMKLANRYVEPDKVVELGGPVHDDESPQLWAWDRDRQDRSIIKLRISRDGGDVVLEGESCDFMKHG